jgi:hypothetical protein
MTDQAPADLAGLLGSLVQQQTAIFQQQTALLQVHAESVRLQQLLVERLLGGSASANPGGSATHSESSPGMSAAIFTNSPSLRQLSTLPPATDDHAAGPPPDVESTTSRQWWRRLCHSP